MATSPRRQQSADHERMVLIGEDREAFLQAVLDPPEPTEKLIAALRRHRTLEKHGS